MSGPTTVPWLGEEPDLDVHDTRLVDDCPEVLAPFNRAGVLHPADVHTAVALCRATAVDADPSVLLATALAVRGPRVGHVCVDLATVADTVTDTDEDARALGELPWPEDLDAWIRAVAGAHELVRVADVSSATGIAHADGDGSGGVAGVAGRAGGEPEAARALTLHATRLYLDRYWRYELRTADTLRRRADQPAAGVDVDELRRGLDELFGEVAGGEVAGGEAAGEPDLQRAAAATAVLRQLSVIAGGPGTGKTTTVARVLTLLDRQAEAAGAPAPRVALVAPTGKAAARLEESLREALTRDELSSAVRERLASAEASTIHRLLGTSPGNRSRFRHDARDPLPHDVVIVDEASMVSLSLIAKLLDALRPDARLVLVGDPQQLRSVEAGVVLGDIVGPALGGLRLSLSARDALTAATGEPLPQSSEAAAPGIGDGIVVLQRVHRFGETSGIADLAAAIQAGDAQTALAVLRSGRADVTFVERGTHARDDLATPLDEIRDEVVATGSEVERAAVDAGDVAAALDAVERLRVLCAHRRGPFGVTTWVPRIEGWLGVPAGSSANPWRIGRPVLVTQNDHGLRLYNGDVGVVTATPDGPRVAFPTADGPRLVSPSRLEQVETVHAMTIHKSQGSQFGHAVVVLPGAESRILSRELFYTGVTRARQRVTVVGSEPAVRAAVERVVQRASGLRDHLWG